MNILLHVCCGPCTVYPYRILTEEGYSLAGYFHNPNIHPFQEFKRRLTALEEFCRQTGFQMAYDRRYGLKEYLREVVFHEENRCLICYRMRLVATAKVAKEQRAEAFSSTLLYSRYQKHEAIRRIGEEVAEEEGVPFYYRDFREGWQEGIDGAVAMELYRQPYCGCIYSEQERYDKTTRKQRVKD
ncbi:MAG: epoxyqueuosine reductase QueH [Proteobacteria bacterium]|nr:epoxyqueuosine reductase QueH [Pseudomonadota bacterium]MBU1688144.1 epoxyqueuosine reductase QueH [Pseudomonadota bacterium]